MPIALHYSSIKQPPKEGQVYGIQVAILDWLRAYFRYGTERPFTFLVAEPNAAEEIVQIAKEIGVPPSDLRILSDRFPRRDFAAFDTIFRPDADPRHLLWQRNLSEDITFTFCGLAHALAGKDSMAVLSRYMMGPSTESDALICPSRAIQKVASNFFAHYADYLKERFGTIYACPVQLPVIPLGIDIERLTARILPEKRARQRAALGVSEDAIVLLWVGRLSHVMKAHPLPMFCAAEDAARRTGRKVHLVMQGYFVPQDAEKAFAELAHDLCKTAQVSFIEADDPRFPDGLWAAGDIFLSLIDNVQESFGLTPIEAIAAGLPRVLSDWDGYRDSVAHGEDGFLVPTIQPPPGEGGALAELMIGGRESHGGYLARVAQCAAVDIPAATNALVALIENQGLREKIAFEAKKRLPHYEWKNIISAYEALWQELRARRQISRRLPLVHPHAPDPFTLYEGFASDSLRATDKLEIACDQERIQTLLTHGINTLALDVMLPTQDIPVLLEKIGAQDLRNAFPEIDSSILNRTLVWLLKLGILRRKTL